jgi:DNA replication protein DnaD
MNEKQARAVTDHLKQETADAGVSLPPFMDDYFMQHLLPLKTHDELKTWLKSMGGTPTQVAAALKVAFDLGEEDVGERSAPD